MSTRCMTIVRQQDVVAGGVIREYEALRIYRHWDGYP